MRAKLKKLRASDKDAYVAKMKPLVLKRPARRDLADFCGTVFTMTTKRAKVLETVDEVEHLNKTNFLLFQRPVKLEDVGRAPPPHKNSSSCLGGVA